jgi:hypothetical protein
MRLCEAQLRNCQRGHIFKIKVIKVKKSMKSVHCKYNYIIMLQPRSAFQKLDFVQKICRASLPGKSAGQVCRASLPGKSAGQVCRASLPGKSHATKLKGMATIDLGYSTLDS